VFKELVAKHEIHYYVGQGSQSFGGGRGSSAITAWVAAHFTKQTVGGQTVYDLTKPLSYASGSCCQHALPLRMCMARASGATAFTAAVIECRCTPDGVQRHSMM
jgi:hypothetical protein